MKRAGLRRCICIPLDTKLDAGRSAQKPTKTGMFYDPLFCRRAFQTLCLIPFIHKDKILSEFPLPLFKYLKETILSNELNFFILPLKALPSVKCT
jgi:hypothetical protein